MITLHFIYNRSTNMNYFINTSQSRKIWDPGIAGSLSFVVLPLLSLSQRRFKERVTKDRPWFSINLSASILKGHNRRKWWSYWETFVEQFGASIIWIYNWSMSTMSLLSPQRALCPLLRFQGLCLTMCIVKAKLSLLGGELNWQKYLPEFRHSLN